MRSTFLLGLLISGVMYPWVGEGISRLGFTLFIATALSITAIPILGRIMIELNIHRSYIGSLTITAAAVDDASGWMLLTVVAAITRAQFSGAATVLMVGETIAYGLLALSPQNGRDCPGGIPAASAS
ncbi:MAG: cation:proton antiporter [Acidobacteria bacterium]|nr:cation:proton antiporter [Acidobacteriota bacterium]